MELEMVQVTTEKLVRLIKEAIEESNRSLGSEQRVEYSDLKELNTRKETKDYLGVSYPCLNDWHKNGILPKTKIGGKVFYRREDILGVINKRG